VKRREFITLLGSGAAVWPFRAHGQGERRRRVGVLIGIADDAQGQARLAAFRNGMQELGWTEGRSVDFDIRFTDAKADRARTFAIELVALAPDVILANTAPVVSALQQQTKTIPIVFVQVLDPVSSGFVESLALAGWKYHGIFRL
jgi:putative tryptophan/tyrosine transport system substrate-binding protein